MTIIQEGKLIWRFPWLKEQKPGRAFTAEALPSGILYHRKFGIRRAKMYLLEKFRTGLSRCTEQIGFHRIFEIKYTTVLCHRYCFINIFQCKSLLIALKLVFFSFF